MDNYATYDLLKHYDILPFISLESGTKAKFKYPHPDILCFDDQGCPICKGGIPFVSWGYSKPKGIKYRCWFAVKTSVERSNKRMFIDYAIENYDARSSMMRAALATSDFSDFHRLLDSLVCHALFLVILS